MVDYTKPPTLEQKLIGLDSLRNQADSAADLFTDLDSKPVDPNVNLKAYRGENLIKSLGMKLGSDEAAGRWYGYSADKAVRYPFDKAPSIFGGAVTRTMDVSPLEVVDAFRNAQYEHAKSALNLNLEKGIPKGEAENLYFKFLNETDDYTSKAKRQILEGKMPSDKFNFLLKSIMDEGVFDKKGPIDIKETFKRGNVGIATALSAGRALPKLAFGLAGLPVDAILGATQTSLDPQEEMGRAYGIDPSLFYQMDPEKFEELYKNYEIMVNKMREDELAKLEKDTLNKVTTEKLGFSYGN